MLADLHAHYPMRVVSDLTPRTTLDQMSQIRHRPTLGDRARALVLAVASKIGSNRSPFDGYRITPETLREGNVGVALSVLFRPFEEMDLGKPYASPPASGYFPKLLQDLEAVEAEVATHDPAQIRVAHNRAELDRCLAENATALVHCVEGGFHLGDTSDEIGANCAELARRGVAYVTVAHLFFRQVATNAPALPFLPDPLYRLVFPQRGGDRLTERGEAVVRGLVRNRILIDICHMDPPAIRELFQLLDDELDPMAAIPVVSTHSGYRFGTQQYMPDEEILLQIQRRDGVVGIILAQHQLNDGLRRHTKTLEQSLDVIWRHVDKIAEITGSHRHIALGTDFDGFIKPTLSGFETMADLTRLEEALHERYGDEDAELMASGNALRVLRQLWPEQRPTPV